MFKKILTTIIIIFIASAALAHEHWVDVTDYLPKLEDKIRVYITSGHSFPLGEFILGEKLLIDTKIITPERKEITYSTKEDKKGVKRLSDEIALTATGIYLVRFNLKKPQVKEPLYYAKSIIHLSKVVIDKEFNPASYTLGSYLEIIPQQLLTTLKKDDELTLKVLCDNKPLKETLEIGVKLPSEKPEDKPSAAEKNFTVKSDRDGIARLKISYPGKYLVTLDAKGTGCSLTFYIDYGEIKEK